MIPRLRLWWSRLVRWAVADPDVDAAIARVEAMQAPPSGYTMAFPAYFVRPLHGEPTYDVGVYVMGSSDAAIAERLVLASRKVMQ